MDRARAAARPALLTASVAAAVGLAGPALAQGAPAGPDPVALAAADHATRAVLIDLGLPEAPTPSEYEIAARALSMIAELTPADADLARLETAAAFGTGDPRLLAAATARVVRLDPGDTVSQLRLITARIADRQTVEARLEIYDRLLGERGVAIDHTVRSRLALDAALIQRERGDLDAFVRMLTLAIDLDGTNKEAHHLAANYFAEYAGADVESKVGLLEMQLNLMWADPIDPNVYFSISRLLAVEGATRQALRFYNLGTSILARAGLLEERHRVEGLALQWLTDGPQVVLNQIDRELRLTRDMARMRYEQDKERDIPDRLLTPPEEVFLDPLYEKIRVIAAMDAQDVEALRTALSELDKYAEYQYEEIRQATALDDEESRQRAFELFAQTLVEIQFMRALANVQINQIAKAVPQLPRAIGEEKWAQVRKPLEAWVALRTGDLDRTRAIIDELGRNSALMQICYAELLVAEGRSTEAAREYERVLRSRAFVPYGAWARSRAMELTGRTDPVTEAGRRMRLLVERVPTSLDTMASDPTAAIALHIEPAARSFEPGERVRLRVSLTNTTPWPLSLGPNRTISSRLLLGVSADDADMLGSSPQPVVADIDRRFRLESGETLAIEIEAERGFNGLVFDTADRGVIRQLWQVWQSPQVDHTGGYSAGPYSLSDSTRKFTRATRAMARAESGELARALLEGGSPERVAEVIESAAAWLWRGDEPGVTDVVDALVTRYGSAGDAERALMIAAMPSAAQTPAVAPFDEAVRRSLGLEAVRQVESPRLVVALALLTRVTDADSPLLTAAAQSDDTALSRLAELITERLRGRRAALATTGPGVDALSGASKAAAIRGDAQP